MGSMVNSVPRLERSVKGAVPRKARYELLQGALSALSNELRRDISLALLEAGPKGLRSSEIARAAKRTPDLIRKHLIELEGALLVQNFVGRDQDGLYSRYVLTEFGAEWLRRLGLAE